MMAVRNPWRYPVVSRYRHSEKEVLPVRPSAKTTRYRRRPSGFVKLMLRHPAKSDLREIARCVERVLATTSVEGLDRIVSLNDRVWKFDPTAKGADARSITVDRKTVEKRRMAARKGGAAGVPFRLRPTFPKGLKRRPKRAGRLFEIGFSTLTLPIRWSSYGREACKPPSNDNNVFHGAVGLIPRNSYGISRESLPCLIEESLNRRGAVVA